LKDKSSYFVSSEKLDELKDSIAYLKQFGFSSIESPAQYRLVVDTNIISMVLFRVCEESELMKGIVLSKQKNGGVAQWGHRT